MKVFQIYDKPSPPCAPYLGYMEAIRDMAESYTLIAPQNFMGAGFYPISQAFADLPEYLQLNTNGPLLGFDAMRVRYLTRHFDHIYLDIDIELLMPIELLDVSQKAGPCLLVGNGNSETGDACWDTYLRMCPWFCRPASLMFAGVPAVEIPDSYFIHHHAKGNYGQAK